MTPTSLASIIRIASLIAAVVAGTGAADALAALTDIPRLVNIATRGQVLTGADVMIGGFIIGGSSNKTVVVRASGPSLTALGVPGALANPMLQLFSGQTQIAVNDNHGDAPNAAALQASGFAPAHPLESAILITLAPGPYTAIVSGAGGGTGVGLVAVFEVDRPDLPLINIATRGKVLTGADVLIGGFIIQGNGPQTVVVRATGPSLTALGVPGALADPLLQLVRSSDQTQIGVNDNWATAANASQLSASGLAPVDSREAAIMATLDPGGYTAIVSGSGGGTGVGIVEVFTVTAPTSTAKTYFISPTGSDTNNGLSSGASFKTFAKAFGTMVGGDILFLMDGIYSVAAGTGIISYLGTNSAQVPSGSATASTEIKALNNGGAKIVGGVFVGRSTRKDSYITFQGMTVVGSLDLYNADYVTVKKVGVNGPLNIGTNDHDMFSDHNLIEDVWIWTAGERAMASNYRAHFNVWRRVVVRGDGCGTSDCSGSNPNIGITVYDSNDTSLQNVIVIDRVLSPTDGPYADFAIAQHTADPRYYFGRNEWLGTMSINSPDAGYYMEPDAGQIVSPTIKISNAVAWDAASDGFNLGRDGQSNLLENLTVRTRGIDPTANGIRVAPEMPAGGTLRNSLVMGSGSFGVNSRYPSTGMDVFFTPSRTVYNQSTCSGTCFTTNPRTDSPGPSLRYITRIEAGSKLKGAGTGGADIGANVVFRYGTDGKRFGETGYNSLTTTPLWPWPNEARIKAEMCATVTRGFCSTGKRLDGVNGVTLTSYIWEYLGNAIPAGFYP